MAENLEDKYIFVYFQFCVSDHSAMIVILSRTLNVDISS